MFVLGSLGGACALARPLSARSARDRSPGPARTLVLLQLTGGNDGLSTLVPYDDDGYARGREALRIKGENVRRIDGRVGLHPALEQLAVLFERGKLALVEGVGYPEPNRSHFRSLDIWHAADARGRGMSAGWIGRCVERLDEPSPLSVVHLGSQPPFALHSAQHAPLVLTPGVLRATDPGHSRALDAARALDESAPEGVAETGELARLRTLWLEAQGSLSEIHTALARRSNTVRYPGSGLAEDLRSAAALIHAELGVRVVSLELDGFDTHKDQRGRYERQMRELDGALAAFLQDLAQSEAGRETIVLAFSEFGRRVGENASGGTDHGAAGLALVLGERVHGGLHGRPPSLDALVDGDLAFTTDFRSLYATCIRHVFALEPETVLGARFPGLSFL